MWGMTAPRHRGPLRVLWLLSIVTVVIGSLLPADSEPIQALTRLNISDKIEHLAAYFVIAFLPAIHERRLFVCVWVLGAAALGVGLEYGQLYSPGRAFEVADITADILGVIIGVLVGLRLRPVLEKAWPRLYYFQPPGDGHDRA